MIDPTKVQHELATLVARRTFLSRTSLGLGATALAGLIQPRLWAENSTEDPAGLTSRGIVNPLHFAPKARRVIFLCMSGGPTQFETFDYKPELAKMSGQPMPLSYTDGQKLAMLQNYELVCLGPQAKFARHGESGQEISEWLPHTAKIADEICIIRSMQTEQINHDPAHTFMNTRTSISGRPSMGAWINYGLGSECDDLPGFVVMSSLASTRGPQPIASRQWHSGFLPSKYQGVRFYSSGDPVHYVTNPPGIDHDLQHEVIRTLSDLNRQRNADVQSPEIETRIAQYELAFRMQMSVPELTDISSEPDYVKRAYGVEGPDGSFAYNCLLARRLAERGVRFVQLYHRGWDHHDHLVKYMGEACTSTDQATAASGSMPATTSTARASSPWIPACR